MAIACAILSAASLSPLTASRIAWLERSYQKRPGSPCFAMLSILRLRAANFCGLSNPLGAPTYWPVVPTLFKSLFTVGLTFTSTLSPSAFGVTSRSTPWLSSIMSSMFLLAIVSADGLRISATLPAPRLIPSPIAWPPLLISGPATVPVAVDIAPWVTS